MIDYAPDAWLLESKSLKLFLFSFRNHGAFHEDCTISVAQTHRGNYSAALAAHRRILECARRHSDRCFWQTGKPPEGLWLPDPELNAFRGRG